MRLFVVSINVTNYANYITALLINLNSWYSLDWSVSSVEFAVNCQSFINSFSISQLTYIRNEQIGAICTTDLLINWLVDWLIDWLIDWRDWLISNCWELDSTMTVSSLLTTLLTDRLYSTRSRIYCTKCSNSTRKVTYKCSYFKAKIT